MKRFLFVLLFGLITISAMSVGVVALAIGQNTNSTASRKISFSTKTGNENLVEVFTDGFDFDFQKEIIGDSDDFKDFYMFQNFCTQGYDTWVGKPATFGGFKDFNNFEIRSRHPFTEIQSELENDIYKKDEMINAIYRHLSSNSDHFSSRDLIGLYDLGNEGNREASSYVEARMPGVNITTWNGARDKVAGEWGISKNGIDKNQFEFIQAASVVDNQNKGARLLIQDLTTHNPYMVDESGNFNILSTASISQQGLTNNLKALNESLKQIKDAVGSAYDNSMILIWGDHSAHGRPQASVQEKILRSHSNLMIKYPHETKNKITIVKDKLVYAPQINSIIKDYFLNKPNSPIDFFASNRFSTNRLLYSMIDGSSYVPTKYDGNKLIEDTSRSWINYAPNEVFLKQQSAILFSELMRGQDE